MSKGNHRYIVRYVVNGLKQYVVDGLADSSSELHAKRFDRRADAESAASYVKSIGMRGVTIVKIGLRKGDN